jgi:hypothetical protein
MSMLKKYMEQVYLETSIMDPDEAEQFITDAKADGWIEIEPNTEWQKEQGWVALKKNDGGTYVAHISNTYKTAFGKEARSISIRRDGDHDIFWPSNKYPSKKYSWEAIANAPFHSQSAALKDLYTPKAGAKTPHWTGD